MYVRAHIMLNTLTDANEFVSAINSDGTVDKFIIEDGIGDRRVNARSLLGVVYAMSDYSEHMYLVNDTNDGVFPSSIDSFRA